RALIPAGRLHSDSRKRLHPFFLDMQRHRIGQVLFEKLRCSFDSLDAITFHAPEEILEAQHFFQRARAGERTRGHEPAKNTDNRGGNDAADDPRQSGRASAARYRATYDDHQDADYDSASYV